MRIFGIDPGSVRTGYGCVDSDGSRHRLVTCGAVTPVPGSALPDRLRHIHDALRLLLDEVRPDCIVVENVFHARNVRSALVLGHARGVSVLAAVETGRPLFEYSPAEIKQAVVGFGRAEKGQMQQVVKMLLGLDAVPAPHDAADALAVAICHAHSQGPIARAAAGAAHAPRHLRSWRHVKLPAVVRRQAP